MVIPISAGGAAAAPVHARERKLAAAAAARARRAHAQAARSAGRLLCRCASRAAGCDLRALLASRAAPPAQLSAVSIETMCKKVDVFSRSWHKRKLVFHSRSLVHDSFHVICDHEFSIAIAIF